MCARLQWASWHVFPPVCVCIFKAGYAPGTGLWLERHQSWASQHLYNKSPARSCSYYVTLQSFTDTTAELPTMASPHMGGGGRLTVCMIAVCVVYSITGQQQPIRCLKRLSQWCSVVGCSVASNPSLDELRSKRYHTLPLKTVSQLVSCRAHGGQVNHCQILDKKYSLTTIKTPQDAWSRYQSLAAFLGSCGSFPVPQLGGKPAVVSIWTK